MARNNIVVVKQASQLIATSWLDRACKDAAYLGTAVIHDGQLVVNHQGAKPTVESVQKVQDHFKDSTVIFSFGESNKTVLEEDRLPFVVELDKAKGDSVAVFLTGNFEGYATKDSSHTSEYHCFDDFLSKKLPKIYKGAGSDIGEFLKELNDPITQQDFSNSWTTRGFMTFMASSGEAVTIFNKGNVFVRTFPWGTVSDGLGYEEKPEAAPAPEPKVEEKKLSLLDKIMAKKAAGTSVPAVEAPKSETAVAKIDAAVNDDKFEDVSLPKDAKDWTNKQKVQWWVGEVGYKPDGYKDLKTKVRRTKGTKLGVLHALASANSKAEPVKVEDAATPISEERKVTDTTAMDHKAELKVDPKNLPEKKPAPENAKDTAPKHVSMDNLPILSPKQKILLKKEFMADAQVIKVLGDDFQAMALEPKRLKELEDNYQTFHDGLGLASMPYLTFDALVKLGSLDLKSLAILAFNNQNDRVRAEIMLNSVTNPTGKAKVAM